MEKVLCFVLSVDYGRPHQVRKKERERNVLFNDALNTFYLQLYGVRHMVKDHSDSEKENPLPPHRLLLSINSKGSFICTIPQTGYHIPRPLYIVRFQITGARCSSVVRTFAHGVMGHRIDHSQAGPIELFLIPASAPRLV